MAHLWVHNAGFESGLNYNRTDKTNDLEVGRVGQFYTLSNYLILLTVAPMLVMVMVVMVLLLLEVFRSSAEDDFRGLGGTVAHES